MDAYGCSHMDRGGSGWGAMKRAALLLLRPLVAGVCLMVASVEAGSDARPNLLWLIAEDLSPDLAWPVAQSDHKDTSVSVH